MSADRHAPRALLVPLTPGRWALAAFGVLSLLSNGYSHGQRYDHVVSVLIAMVVIAAGVTPPSVRPMVRRAVTWLAGTFGELAGVLAGTSMDEAMTLVAAAIAAGLLSLLFTGVRPRSRHAAL